MVSFDKLLGDLHKSTSGIAAKVEEQDDAIIID
jgi:hypothetical protein